MRRIYELMLNLRPSALNDVAATEIESVVADGGLDEVAEELSELLAEDYRKNTIDNEIEWEFDYVVDVCGKPWSDNPQSGLMVLTRYYSNRSTYGNILYGRRILRIEDRRYLMWAE